MTKQKVDTVHLDHLIPRESLRWIDLEKEKSIYASFKRPTTILPYKELVDRGEMLPVFPLLRKPDFQRETSSWTPEDCVSLLESIVNSLIIPSLIVWKSPENNLLYILDGAHRISVMRAWMLVDWGDKAPEDYYERHEYQDEIKRAAQVVRNLVKNRIGQYDDFDRAGKKYLEASRRGFAGEQLGQEEFKRGIFYTEMLQGAGFFIQEVSGDYEIAEASFLKINRSGQPLDDWETTLIENRNSSLARAVMSIANAGTGRYWPESTKDPSLDVKLRHLTKTSEELHRKIFIPPLKTPIYDANVPFVAATKYFPKHAYLLELLPVIMKQTDVEEVFARDRDREPEVVIKNGLSIMERTLTVFDHLTGDSNNPLSLSLVPLFYFYTNIGRYVRSSLYGFITWLMSGSQENIRIRKIIFSAHRGRFEHVIFSKDVASAITRRVGSGPRAIDATVKFYQELLELLVHTSSGIETEEFRSQLKPIMTQLTASIQKQTVGKGRRFTSNQKTTINLREIFKSALRCELCGGILDLRMGTQYDHAIPFSDSKITDVKQGRPTHPFCNNQREAIEQYRNGTSPLKLPPIFEHEVSQNSGYQLSLFDLFKNTSFPDE